MTCGNFSVETGLGFQGQISLVMQEPTPELV